jgi:curved DNA-binding protein CbpA
MSLKNYYTILGVPQSAEIDEIRLAFRKLAKQYHPDKAPDNPFAAAHFKEIQEAYEVLGNAGRRAAYDEERWLRGLTSRTSAAVRITPEWVLKEAARLRRHMETVDTYRMNHAALRDYIAALLSPEHLSVLQAAPGRHAEILDEILASTRKLRHEYTTDVARQLLLLAGDHKKNRERIAQWESGRRLEARWNIYRPVIIVSIALLICALIWWLR